MRLLTVRHVTIYRYSEPVGLGEHRMMFRPRESHVSSNAIEITRSEIDPQSRPINPSSATFRRQAGDETNRAAYNCPNCGRHPIALVGSRSSRWPVAMSTTERAS
jgi:hypothetical protein